MNDLSFDLPQNQLDAPSIAFKGSRGSTDDAYQSQPESEQLARNRAFGGEFKYCRGTEIFGEKEPAKYIHQIIKGAVRSYKLLSDGRRQINAFHLPGDIFGIEDGEFHRFTAEALIPTTVRIIARENSQLDGVTDDAQLIGKLRAMATKSLLHAQDHMLLLGRKTALKKVAAFLVEMDQRSAVKEAMILPMARHDIADYILG